MDKELNTVYGIQRALNDRSFGGGGRWGFNEFFFCIHRLSCVCLLLEFFTSALIRPSRGLEWASLRLQEWMKIVILVSSFHLHLPVGDLNRAEPYVYVN